MFIIVFMKSRYLILFQVISVKWDLMLSRRWVSRLEIVWEGVGIWRHIIWYIGTKTSKESSASGPKLDTRFLQSPLWYCCGAERGRGWGCVAPPRQAFLSRKIQVRLPLSLLVLARRTEGRPIALGPEYSRNCNMHKKVVAKYGE
jgi:hypothetical protein